MHSRVYMNMSMCYLKLNTFNDSLAGLKAINTVISLKPDYPNALIKRAEIESQIGDGHEALQDLY